jgi:hypothetical protein
MEPEDWHIHSDFAYKMDYKLKNCCEGRRGVSWTVLLRSGLSRRLFEIVSMSSLVLT